MEEIRNMKASKLLFGLVPVHEKMSGRIGKENIEAVYKATNFDASKFLSTRIVGAKEPPLFFKGLES